ncbi:hypothetical protein [Clostridium sp.]|uniref:hypothetical protein n=1 Tax=Clostridium sp. TaxID=1506 RepID=UPI00284DD985|nr:hypothetical protein [Clostridium sp.]MDR3595688.1 hypothetical protein [Clostridium sp.]
MDIYRYPTCILELGAHQIIGKCNLENISLLRLLERLSMRREGHFKKPAFFREDLNGKPMLWHYAYQYSILAEEFLNIE